MHVSHGMDNDSMITASRILRCWELQSEGRLLSCQLEMALSMTNILQMKDPQQYEVRDYLKNPENSDRR